MIIPDNIAEKVAISLRDQYFDLKGLSTFSAMAVSTLRNFIRTGNLPAYKVHGKILIKRSEFDAWINTFKINRKQDLSAICDDILENLKD